MPKLLVSNGWAKLLHGPILSSLILIAAAQSGSTGPGSTLALQHGPYSNVTATSSFRQTQSTTTSALLSTETSSTLSEASLQSTQPTRNFGSALPPTTSSLSRTTSATSTTSTTIIAATGTEAVSSKAAIATELGIVFPVIQDWLDDQSEDTGPVIIALNKIGATSQSLLARLKTEDDTDAGCTHSLFYSADMYYQYSLEYHVWHHWRHSRFC